MIRMTLRRQSDGREPDAAAQDHRPSSARPIDLVHLARQTLGDRGLEREVLDLMARQLEQSAVRIDLATDGERRSLAHALKGAARNIGAFALAERAETVEREPGDAPARIAMLKEVRRTRAFIRTLLD